MKLTISVDEKPSRNSPEKQNQPRDDKPEVYGEQTNMGLQTGWGVLLMLATVVMVLTAIAAPGTREPLPLLKSRATAITIHRKSASLKAAYAAAIGFVH